MTIAALILAIAAIALAGSCVIATRVFLRDVTAALSQPPQAVRATLTPEEERRLREGFDVHVRRRW